MEFVTGECIALIEKLAVSEKETAGEPCKALADMLDREFNKPLNTGLDFKVTTNEGLGGRWLS